MKNTIKTLNPKKKDIESQSFTKKNIVKKNNQ